MGTSPAVRARAQAAVAPALSINRPTWDDMNKNYPNESTKSDAFYPMVGKNYVAAMKVNPEGYANTCAARMSYALNRSGMKLPVAPDGGNMKGDDKLKGDNKLNYWIRVRQLSKRLKDQFGKPDNQLTHKLISDISDKALIKERVDKTKLFLEEIKLKKGIIVFEVTGWPDASGHFTLWDGSNLVYVGEGQHNDINSYEYYFWFLRAAAVIEKGVEVIKIAQTTKAYLWELK